MRGLLFLLIPDSVRQYVYRESKKCLALFVKMIERIGQPLIRLGLRQATFSSPEAAPPFSALRTFPQRGHPKGKAYKNQNTQCFPKLFILQSSVLVTPRGEGFSSFLHPDH